MKSVLLLAKRELGYYLNTTWGYAILAMILVIDGILFNSFAMGQNTERYSTDVLQDFFFFSSGTTMIAGVLITMRLVAEERSSGTFTLLQTAPVSEAQIITGKYLGALSFLTLITACTIYMPILIEINGKVSWAQIGAGYLGLFLLGATTASIGTFGSAIAKNQLFASILGGIFLVLMLLGWLLGKVTEAPLDSVFSYIALFDRHFQPFMRGKINSESIIFYLSTTFIFLLISIRVLQSRRIS
ncbi:MAG: ABC transporter permease subunit [Myxococcota bacterium]|nr:ABC transporter permease subunit [Myxococcota bacterium]